MDRLITFLIAVIIAILIILGVAPIVFPAPIPEYEYSEECAYSYLDIVRDENGTISTFAHPELYGPGAFNLTISNSPYHAIQLNEVSQRSE